LNISNTDILLYTKGHRHICRIYVRRLYTLLMNMS